MTDVTSPEFRCYELDMEASPGQTSTQTVSAGSTVGFQANGPIYHPGVSGLRINDWVYAFLTSTD